MYSNRSASTPGALTALVVGASLACVGGCGGGSTPAPSSASTPAASPTAFPQTLLRRIGSSFSGNFRFVGVNLDPGDS